MSADDAVNGHPTCKHRGMPWNFQRCFRRRRRSRGRQALRKRDQRGVQQIRRVWHCGVVLVAEAKPQVACFSVLELKRGRNLECGMPRGWIDAMAGGTAGIGKALKHKDGRRTDEVLCCLTLF